MVCTIVVVEARVGAAEDLAFLRPVKLLCSDGSMDAFKGAAEEASSVVNQSAPDARSESHVV